VRGGLPGQCSNPQRQLFPRAIGIGLAESDRDFADT